MQYYDENNVYHIVRVGYTTLPLGGVIVSTNALMVTARRWYSEWKKGVVKELASDSKS